MMYKKETGDFSREWKNVKLNISQALMQVSLEDVIKIQILVQ